MRYVFIFLFIITQASGATLSVGDIARISLEANIVSLPQGEFLAAGTHQFGSLWTRDFCFSVPALLTLQKFSLVKNHLNYLITHRRSDGLVSIYADSMNPMLRVVTGSVNHEAPFSWGAAFVIEMLKSKEDYVTLSAM